MSKSGRYRNTYSITSAVRTQYELLISIENTLPTEQQLLDEIKKEIGNGDAETVGRVEV